MSFEWLELYKLKSVGVEMAKTIKEKSFKFALDIIDLYKELVKNSEFVISKQLLKSGTSIGANVSEAEAGSSKRDFLNKMAIASKEARETDYWLRLLDQSELTDVNLDMYLSEIIEIKKMLTSIVMTTQSNIKNSK